MSTSVVEVNLDGLVGPSHHYAGLAFGNEASLKHRAMPSSPRHAAIQGLEKAWQVARLGIPQAVLPPQNRPRLDWLAELGFAGPPSVVLSRVSQEAPQLLSAAYSASPMWCANAGTVSPSTDTPDRKVHVTPANLNHGLHRSLESEETLKLFRAIFPSSHFEIHLPLPIGRNLQDEGAANHTRLAPTQSKPGIHLFVYGVDSLSPEHAAPEKFPPRQTRLASEAIIRRHGLDPAHCVLAQQHPDTIDAGVFHHDVIGVGHEDFMLIHGNALMHQDAVLEELQKKYTKVHGSKLELVILEPHELSLTDAVSSYLFNSQILTEASGRRTMICPSESESNPAAARCLNRLVESSRCVESVRYLNLRESMNNGGGPACLRLRAPLSRGERNAVHSGVWLTESRYNTLRSIIERMYREQITFEDLKDLDFLAECSQARKAILHALELDDFELDGFELDGLKD